MLKSAFSPIITSHRFAASETLPNTVTSVSDLTVVSVSSDDPEQRRTAHVSALALQPVGYTESLWRHHQDGPSGLGADYQKRNVRFYCATIMRSDMSVVQQLCYNLADSGAPYTKTVVPTQWHSRLAQSSARLERRSFVVDDQPDAEDIYTEPALRDQNTRENIAEGRRVPDHAQSTRNLSINYQNAYKHLAEGKANNREDVLSVFQRVKNALQAEDNGQTQPRLLL